MISRTQVLTRPVFIRHSLVRAASSPLEIRTNSFSLVMHCHRPSPCRNSPRIRFDGPLCKSDKDTARRWIPQNLHCSRTIVKILTESKTLNLFKKNPQAYMDQVAKLISSTMQLFIVDGIKYTKLGDTEFYAQELFDSEELTGYLERNMFESHSFVYD